MKARPMLGVAVAGLLALGLLAGAMSSGPVRVYLKNTPAATRLNTPALRRVDAWLYNIRSSIMAPDELGDNGPAADIRLFDPNGLARNGWGSIFVADRGFGGPGRVVWEISGRDARVIAGTGRQGLAETGIPARESSLGSPQGLCLDSSGRLYIADSYNHVVLRLEGDGRLTRFAGSGRPGAGGDGGPAVEAELNQPYDVRADESDNLYVADHGNHRIRMVTAAGVIRTVAGTGDPGYSGDGGPATGARLRGPYGVFPDRRRGLLIADSRNHVIRQVGSDGTIRTIAGTGRAASTGDDGPARSAAFDTPQGLWVDASGRIYIGDEHNHRIRVIDETGTVRHVTGTGAPGYSVDGTEALTANIDDPESIVGLPDGTVLFTEAGNHRVRGIDAAGRLFSIAGGREVR